jgi:predicted O-methyltransferase YrrM
VWEQLVPQLPARRSFLEIGSYEGRSTVWTVENMLEDGGAITCIDTWEGGEEHVLTGEDMAQAEATFGFNVSLARSKFPEREVRKAKGTSYEFLSSLATQKAAFDFIYIDGSHIAKDVLTDACMAWPLLKKDGIMVFDDYLWGEPRDALHRPKLAVDAFVNLFAEEVQTVHTGYQYIVRRAK